MYGYYGAGYDLGDYEGDDMGDLDGVMDYLKKEVAFGIPVWAVALGGAALLYTGVGKKVLGMVGLGKKAAKKNPKRRRARKVKANPRRRRNGAVKHNRRRSRRSRR